MRKVGGILLALTLLAPSAFAAETGAPLAPGKPAGVKTAQSLHPIAMWVVGVSLVAGGILFTTTGKGSNSINTSISTGSP